MHAPKAERAPAPAGAPVQAPAQTPTGWFHVGHHLHHLQVALAVASLVGLLHAFGYLGWLDAAMLRLAGAADAAAVRSSAPDGMPEMLLIDDAMFERDFEQRSPLDRAGLERLLRALLGDPARSPKVLVIDLDISDNGQDAAQGQLDAVLGRAVRAGLQLVLAVPPSVNSPAAITRKRAWMRSLRDQACAREATGTAPQGSLRFASALVTTHADVVLQYSRDELTLGTAARTLVGKPGACGQPDEVLDALLLGPGRGELKPFPVLMPFNAHFFGAVAGQTRRVQSLDAPLGAAATAGPAPGLAGKVVFLGGSYDPRDRFSVPLAPDGKPMDGVELHAATFYSALHPVTEVNTLLAWAADVVLGFACGWAFQLLWAVQARSAGLAGWWGYFAPKFVLLLSLAAAGLLACISVMMAAHWFYPNNYWISPGPVVLGVFAKLLLTALHRDGDHAGEHGSHTAPPATDTPVRASPAARGRLDWAFVLVLVFACIIIVLRHH